MQGQQAALTIDRSLPIIVRPQKINEWPEDERPREKLLERGAQVLSDAELLAVLIGTGTQRRNILELARAHIAEFGSLRALLSSDYAGWKNKEGFGIARYAKLQAALELARRHLLGSMKVGSIMARPDVTRMFLLSHLRDRPYEIFCMIFLDNHHRLIAFE